MYDLILPVQQHVAPQPELQQLMLNCASDVWWHTCRTTLPPLVASSQSHLPDLRVCIALPVMDKLCYVGHKEATIYQRQLHMHAPWSSDLSPSGTEAFQFRPLNAHRQHIARVAVRLQTYMYLVRAYTLH